MSYEEDTEGAGIVATPETDREVVRLWRAWRTVNEMCADRGYELDDEEVHISLDDFRKKYTANGLPDRRRMNFQAQPSPSMIERLAPLEPSSTANGAAATTDGAAAHPPAVGNIWVEFVTAPKIGIKQMRDFAQHVQKNNFGTGVLVYSDAMTNAALKVIPAVQPAVIEYFSEQDLLVNITHHELVPTHVPLSAAEKKRLLERYRLKENQLPRIQAKDPVARYLGLKRGQVVKIIRRSETAGRYASYRLVVA